MHLTDLLPVLAAVLLPTTLARPLEPSSTTIATSTASEDFPNFSEDDSFTFNEDGSFTFDPTKSPFHLDPGFGGALAVSDDENPAFDVSDDNPALDVSDGTLGESAADGKVMQAKANVVIDEHCRDVFGFRKTCSGTIVNTENGKVVDPTKWPRPVAEKKVDVDDDSHGDGDLAGEGPDSETADILNRISHGSGRVTLEQYFDYFNVTDVQHHLYATVEAMFHARDKDNNGVLTIDEIEEMLPSDDVTNPALALVISDDILSEPLPDGEVMYADVENAVVKK